MTLEEVLQPAHSPIGASSCERWTNCPGSVQLLKNLPPFKGSKYTAEGTVAHSLGEKALNAIISSAPYDLDDEIGRSYVEEGFEIEVSEEMMDAVKVYTGVIAEYMTEHFLRLEDLQTEVRFALTHVDPEAFGTCDAVLVAPMNRIIVIDYKHGQGHAVEVTDNYQLQYYALGAYYGLPESERSEIGYVEMVIVQPRARHLDGPVRRVTYRVDDLLQFEVRLAAAIQRVRECNPTLQTGSWCKFCNAKAVCPAIRANLEKEAQVAFSQVEVEPLQLPEVGTLTPERIAQLMKNADLFQSWIKAVINLGTVTAENGVDIPGYKLVTKYGRRRWIDEKDVEDAFELEFADKIYNRKLKSPAQMEKLLKTARKAELEPYFEIPVSGVTLVSEDDAREGVNDSLTNAFASEWA